MNMGDEPKRFIRSFGNKPVTATIGGKKCYFRSTFEYNWSRYQEFLKQHGEILDWDYEPKRFYFPDEKTAPVQYRVDFKITQLDGSLIYQELKGWHDGQTNKKFQRMSKHYPDVIMDLVLMRMPKKGKSVNRMRVAEKYVRRIIDGGKILRQVRGII